MLQAHFSIIPKHYKSRIPSTLSFQTFQMRFVLQAGQYECKDISFLLHARRNRMVNANEIKCEKAQPERRFLHFV